jgi:hypothetical protein
MAIKSFIVQGPGERKYQKVGFSLILNMVKAITITGVCRLRPFLQTSRAFQRQTLQLILSICKVR